jgi:hypothetical protein
MKKMFKDKKKLALTLMACVLLVHMSFYSAMGKFSDQSLQIKSTIDQQYKLLIIAPDKFIDELQPLQTFKDQTNRPTILISLTEVYNDFENLDWDEAEQVKRCIASYEQSYGIDYVILVGDIDQFPGRFTWWGLPDQLNWAVTDLYYADLYKQGTNFFDDWNSNGNTLYGEIEFEPDGYINNDNIDYIPDVAVGRIPASKESEVTTYVNKVISYESLTTPVDTWFKNAALYTGDWLSGANSKNDLIGDLITYRYFNLIKRYYNWGTQQWPPGIPDVVIEDFNNGIGFFNYIGHGSTSGFFNYDSTVTLLSASSLAYLTNADKLPVGFGCACNTGAFAHMSPFSPYIDVKGGEHYGSSLGEEFDYGSYPHLNLPRPAPLQNDNDGGIWHNNKFYSYDLGCFAEYIIFGNPNAEPGTGAIAYVGARSGSRDTGLNLDYFFFEAYAEGNNVLGDIWKNMIEKYYYYYDIQNINSWPHPPSEWGIGHKFAEPQKYILFGDPSLKIGGLKRPQVKLQGGFGIKAIIQNDCDFTITDAYCDFSIAGDALMLIGKQKQIIPIPLPIPPSEEAVAETGLILGFGPATITMSAEFITEEDEHFLVVEKATGFILGPYVLELKQY